MESFKKLIKELYTPDVEAEVLTYIFMVSYQMDAHMETITARYGITRTQFNVLNILSQQYPRPATVNTIRERTIVIKSDISRILKRIEKAGLIDFEINKDDRRLASITINDKGLQVFKEIVKNRDELLKPFSTFSAEEIQQMRTMLRQLLTNIENNPVS